MNLSCLMCGGGSFPKFLRYSRDHCWVRLEGDIYTIGITGFAVERLGDILLVDLPEEGENVDSEQILVTFESATSVSEKSTPMAGQVVVVNKELVEHPELVNDNPYTGGWLVKMKAAVAEFGSFMDNITYGRLVTGDT